MKEYLLMSNEERKKLEILSKVRLNEITIKEASALLKLSYRHCRRVYKRYITEGDSGLIHKSRGKVSNRAKSACFKKQILEIYSLKYKDFGPTLASEKLAEEGFLVEHNTLWRWLIEAGKWKKGTNSKSYRKRRKSRPHFGELIQLDGSDHEWFEGRAPRCNLMNMVDDATGKTLSILCNGETTETAMLILKKWIEKYGIPHSIYVDQHVIYSINKANTKDGLETQFARACKELGIEIIYAYSPQAKGRVERNHGVYQDRFVKELRLKNISTVRQANELLEQSFVDSLNKKFSVSPSSLVNLHRPLTEDIDLNKAFSFCTNRVINNDWTIRFKNKFYQILPQPNLPLAKSKVELREYLDQSIHIFHDLEELIHSEINKENVLETYKKSPYEDKAKKYLRIKELKEKGLSIRAIAREVNSIPRTVRNYLKNGVTAYDRSNISYKTDAFEVLINDLIKTGYSSSRIHEIIINKGFQGSRTTTMNFIKKLKLKTKIVIQR